MPQPCLEEIIKAICAKPAANLVRYQEASSGHLRGTVVGKNIPPNTFSMLAAIFRPATVEAAAENPELEIFGSVLNKY